MSTCCPVIFYITDISGEILYSDATRERLVFDMEARVPANSEVTMAELRLYQNAPHKLHLAGRKSQKQDNNARVSVYWVEVLENGANRSSLVDSRSAPLPHSLLLISLIRIN